MPITNKIFKKKTSIIDDKKNQHFSTPTIKNQTYKKIEIKKPSPQK